MTSAAAPGRDRAALAALAGSLVLYALLLALLPATGDQDAALHAIYARFPTSAVRVLSVWARPAFAIPYLLPARLGYPAMRLCTVLLCALGAWLTYRIARRLELRHAWLAIPFVLLQPALVPVGIDTMTEPTFALLLAAGTLAIAHGHRALGAAVLSLLPLARPEGPIVLAVVGLLWLPDAIRERRAAPILLLALGMVLWQASAVAVTHDIGFLSETFPWSPTHSGYAPGAPSHYVYRWPHIIGLGLLPFWLAGLWPSRRAPVLRLALLATAAVFVVHTALFATGSMSSTGFDRYFASLAPYTALVALAGADAIAARAPRALPALAGALMLLETAQAFVAVDSLPYNHMPAATLEATRVAAAHGEARAPYVLSADHFGYVFLDRDRPGEGLPVGDRARALAVVDSLPAGTFVLWDNVTGDWWFHLRVEDFEGRGYRLLWERRFTLQSPRGPRYLAAATSHYWFAYYWFGAWPVADFRQAVLVRGAPRVASP